jgi:hypothetical protein
MTHDLDQLRAVLRDRAALAPSADDLLPRTRQLARRRQVRRRAGLVTGVVVVTALALVGATVFGTPPPRHDPTAIRPDPTERLVTPPTLPFTVGALPAGLRWGGWDVILKPLSPIHALFTGPQEVVNVDLLDRDLAGLYPGVHRTFTVHGVTATIAGDAPANHFWAVTWPVGRGHWIYLTVTADSASGLSESDLISLVGAITTKPGIAPTALRIRYVPPGFTLFSWHHSDRPDAGLAEDDVELCATAQNCVVVLAGYGNLAGAKTLDGNPITVGRQYDSGHWIGVYAPGADPAVLNHILQEVSLG